MTTTPKPGALNSVVGAREPRAVSVKTRMNKRECSKIDAHAGIQLRRRRLMAGIRQEDVGKVLGVSFQQVQKYENGTNRVSMGRLYALANPLNATIHAFFDGQDRAIHTDHAVNGELRRVEKFAASREGMAPNLAYLDVPNVRVRKLAVEVLRLGADRSEKSGAVSHGTRN